MPASRILSSAEPFFFPGGPTGCLLVHGFTGTPKEMRWLGEYLSSQGHSVLGVRLAGHATHPEDMRRTRWVDWLASVEDGWNLLAGCTRQVFIIGLSMGGILSLLAAARYPAAGVVALSTPHHLPNDPRLPFVKWISKLIPYTPKGKPDWHDLQAYRQHVSYTSDPTRSYAELRDLIVQMHLTLPQVTAPALLVYSRNDQTVKPQDRHAEKIYAALGSPVKQVFWVENSGHVLTEDAERGRVFQAIQEFILQVSQPARFASQAVQP
jgi:carboxylesterase